MKEHAIHCVGPAHCSCGQTHQNNPSQSWHEGLENLALTEPDPNQALYNLPQLKGFIHNLIKSVHDKAYERGKAETLEEFLKIYKDKSHD